MRFYSKILLFISGVLLYACSESPIAENSVSTGFVSVAIEQNEILNIKKATEQLVYSAEILKRGTSEVVYTIDDVSKMPEKVALEEGFYTIKAISKNETNVGFDNPKYSGAADFTVVAGETTSVEVTCTLQNVKVSIAFAQSIKDNFDDYSAKIVTGTEEVVFSKDEVRSAFIPVSPFKVEVTLTDKIGRVHTISNSITEVEPRDHFKFVVDLLLNSGNGSLNITVDPTTYDKIVELNVFDNVAIVMALPAVYTAEGVAFYGKKLNFEGDCSFEYRIKGAASWSVLDKSLVKYNTASDGTQIFYTDPLSVVPYGIEAEYRAVFLSKKSDPKSYYVELLPNLNFDTWYQSGKTWYPNASDGNSFWATGNEGVNMSPVNKDSNTYPVSDDVQGGTGYAVKLQTISVPLVKIAAGNIFTGKYKTNITNPASSVTFGRPWSYPNYRPSVLEGYFKYKGVDYDGKKDFGHIYVRFENWGTATDRPASPTVVGYGEFKTSDEVTTYTAFTAPITYSSDLPITHVVLVATSSIEGSDFKGGVGSVLCIDNFVLH